MGISPSLPGPVPALLPFTISRLLWGTTGYLYGAAILGNHL